MIKAIILSRLKMYYLHLEDFELFLVLFEKQKQKGHQESRTLKALAKLKNL